MNYRKLPSSNVGPKLSWFDELSHIDGKSYILNRRELIALNSINTQVNGFENNLVRATGTDKVNKENIKTNIQVNGVLVDVQPPYVVYFDGEYLLLDGYTRFQAISELNIDEWVFNVVEIREGFTLEEVRYEIGLGANNHPPSKAASKEDFKKALSHWITSQEQTPSLGDCVNWINSISHSFAQTEVVTLCEKTLNQERCSASMQSWDSKTIEDKFGKIYGKKETFAWNTSNSTYFMRNAWKVVETAAKTGTPPSLIPFLAGVLAEDASDVRESASKVVDRANETFEALFQLRLKKGENFKPFVIQGFAPQIIGEENPDQLVQIDE